MSHFSRIQTEMTDPKFVRMALKDLGFQFEESEEGSLPVQGFARQTTQAHIRVKIPLSADIGLVKRGEHFAVVADWSFVRGINQKDFTQRMAQRYAYHATRDKLEQQGFNMVEEKVEETGQIRIVLRRMA